MKRAGGQFLDSTCIVAQGGSLALGWFEGRSFTRVRSLRGRVTTQFVLAMWLQREQAKGSLIGRKSL